MPAEVVAAGALSHSPMMFVPGLEAGPGAQRYMAAVGSLSAAIDRSGAETAVVFFPDHFRAARYDLMPSFCVGVGRLGTRGDWHLPKRDLRTDGPLARHILGHLLSDGFDPAYSADLCIDHGGAQPIEVLGLGDKTIVAILVNCAAPPLPALRRVRALGRSVGEALRSFGEDRKVAVVGSGGLSHDVPLPGWEVLDPAEITRWQTFVSGIPADEVADREKARISQILALVGGAGVQVDPDLDGEFLGAFERGDIDAVAGFDDEVLQARGGSGMHEVRTWLAAAAAAGSVGATTLAYEPIPAWLSGMGVIALTPPG